MTSHRDRALTPNSYVSIALVLTIIVASLYVGRQVQRVDAIENGMRDMQAELRSEVREMRGEVRAVRDLILQQQRGERR